MPTYRVEVEHTTTARETLEVEANSIADAEARADNFEKNGRRERSDVLVKQPRETSKFRSSEFRVIAVRER